MLTRYDLWHSLSTRAELHVAQCRAYLYVLAHAGIAYVEALLQQRPVYVNDFDEDAQTTDSLLSRDR